MKAFALSFIRAYQDVFYRLVLRYHLRDASSVLDVGCGANSPLKEIKKTFRSVGVDVFPKSIRESKKQHIHDDYICCDIRRIHKYVSRKSFDAVVALDVVEHLSKKESLLLLKRLEAIAKIKVVVLTPNGYYKQEALEGNPYQVHRSGWSVGDFLRLGYRVYGLRGAKFIRGEHATITRKPWIFWGLCAFISEVLFYFFPVFSYDLFAVKQTSTYKAA